MKFKLIIDKDAEEEIVAVVHETSALTDQIEDLVRAYTGNYKITVYNEDEMKQLCFSDIECITVIDRKIFAIDGTGEKYRINQRLCDLEQILPSYFIRINKSTIANENRILRFGTAYTGAVDAIFKCGYKDYVSRRCFAEIKRRLNGK
jgi:DNA-binding LytR/AlgR family response regulator